MIATEAKLLSFPQNSPQFVIPIYHCTYSWTDKQCRQLWDDILRARSSEPIAVLPLQTLEDAHADILGLGGNPAKVNGTVLQESGTHAA